MFELPPAPRMSGAVLRSVVAATGAEPVRRTLLALMRKELGIQAAFALPASRRDAQPLDVRPIRARDRYDRPSQDLPLPEPSGVLPTAAVFQARYEAGDTDPVAVTERAFAEARRLASATPSMRVLCAEARESALRDAEASAARWREGRPRGPLDGVPVPIKEEFDIEGHGARLGTDFVPERRDAGDSTPAARLRAAGAILLGHTPMTEMGMSPLGGNVNREMPRNAHAADRLAGGSSTGSGVAVASGLAPVALGVDGGGSIRIPAAYNGVFGIKPTFGRVSRFGGPGGTMTLSGPIGASVRDLAVFLEAVSGADPEDALTHGTPAVEAGTLVEALGRGVAGLRIGVLDAEIDRAEPEVRAACREALDALEADGATVVSVRLPLAEHAPGLGYVTIGLETYTTLLDARRDHWHRMGPDLQLLCRLLSGFRSDDYLDAQCLRATLRHETAELLREVDVLALPTTATEAPLVTDLDMRVGFADTPALHAACRFAFLGNLTGLPGGTAPVGSGAAGLPVGLQIVGDAFDEATVLQVLAHLERTGVASVRAPRLPVHPLGD
jgi:aspartyl-tRNA(Asn)/glutamyl-tRNA(Gln) amidotransferase subunit A